MECLASPGTSQTFEVKEVLEKIVEEVAGANSSTLDSPSFSTSPLLGENTNTSSDAITDPEISDVSAIPIKRKRGRPPKNANGDMKPSASRRKKPIKSDDSEDYITLSNETPKKKPRGTSKATPALRMTSRYDQNAGCLSQKVCKKPRRRYDSPDPFEDDDMEFERVTKKMTAPRKWAIDAFHHATVETTSKPSNSFDTGLRIMPFALITKYHSGVPDAGIPIRHETDTCIFTE